MVIVVPGCVTNSHNNLLMYRNSKIVFDRVFWWSK